MRSRWLVPVIFGIALLAATAGTAFVLSARASAVLERELDERLLGLGRAAAHGANPADLRTAGKLENLFLMDRESRSIADARPGIVKGARYTLLDYDPDAAKAAREGRESVSSTFEVEGVPLKSAYVPAENGAVAVVVASPDFTRPLQELRRLPWLALLFGVVAAAVFAFAIVAARRRLEASAEASLKLERLALAGRLAAQVAHEIRNPLAILRGSVQLAEGALAKGTDARPLLSDVVEEVDRINGLVEDFLSLSREVALRRERCDLNEIAEKAASLAEIGARRKVGRRLYPAPVWVEADPRRVRQALLALLINGLEAGPTATVEVRTGMGAAGPFAVVADDGPGMTPETLRRAGDPFFTTKAAGTGLGLSVVRQIALAHGAELRLSSEPGRGTEARLAFSVVPDGAMPERMRA